MIVQFARQVFFIRRIAAVAMGGPVIVAVPIRER